MTTRIARGSRKKPHSISNTMLGNRGDCASVMFFLGFAIARTGVHGYVPCSRVHSLNYMPYSRPLYSKLFGPNGDFNEDMGSTGDSNVGGEALAKDFFNEMRKREETSKATDTPSQTDNNEDEIIFRIQNPGVQTSVTRASRIVNNEAGSAPTRKFTGQESFFKNAQRPSVPGSGAQGRTPREMMMEQEYRLVGRAERGIAVQAVVAVIALAFYIYVGLSGGIVSGPDAQMQDFGADDEIPFEQLMPVQRDHEVSVWL